MMGSCIAIKGFITSITVYSSTGAYLITNLLRFAIFQKNSAYFNK